MSGSTISGSAWRAPVWLGFLLVAGCTSTPTASASLRAGGQAFGTTWHVSWLGGVQPAVVEPALQEVFERIDRSMSSWRPDSEIARLAGTSGKALISEPLFEVVSDALAVAAASGGAFDPTVEPLLELWGFRDGVVEAAPTDAEVEQALQSVGWQRVDLERDGMGRPWLDLAGTKLDLSGIAKGYAVDRASEALSALGVASHLVEVGGEVRAHGTGPRGSWVVGVEMPDGSVAPGEAFAARVPVVNRAVATSGDYRNVRWVNGVAVAHTMNPSTGRPVATDVLSASVTASTCQAADAWATALRVLGADAGMALVDARPDLEAALQVQVGSSVVFRRSPGFPIDKKEGVPEGTP